jgi:hypothetical protein
VSAIHGHTPLDVAVVQQQLQQQRGHGVDIIQLLISKGAQRSNEGDGGGKKHGSGGEL